MAAVRGMDSNLGAHALTASDRNTDLYVGLGLIDDEGGSDADLLDLDADAQPEEAQRISSVDRVTTNVDVAV
jgi:hypothetical protein